MLQVSFKKKGAKLTIFARRKILGGLKIQPRVLTHKFSKVRMLQNELSTRVLSMPLERSLQRVETCKMGLSDSNH